MVISLGETKCLLWTWINTDPFFLLKNRENRVLILQTLRSFTEEICQYSSHTVGHLQRFVSKITSDLPLKYPGGGGEVEEGWIWRSHYADWCHTATLSLIRHISSVSRQRQQSELNNNNITSKQKQQRQVHFAGCRLQVETTFYLSWSRINPSIKANRKQPKLI